MLIARATDIGVLDRRSVRAALWRGTPIELVVEDGFDRAIGFRADLDGAFGAIGAGKGERCRDRLESPTRDGAGSPGFARTTPLSPAR